MKDDKTEILELIKEIKDFQDSKTSSNRKKTRYRQDLMDFITERISVDSSFGTQKENKIMFERLLHLDAAQTAIVLLTATNSHVLEDFEAKRPIKPYIEVLYLRFLTIFQKVVNSPQKFKQYPHILDYVKKNPKLDRIGCGKFFGNFFKHVQNFLQLNEFRIKS
ncbi:MAG: hypothetical protein ACTSRW_04245 [Candidatus Helarchaeota archaeon]